MIAGCAVINPSGPRKEIVDKLVESNNLFKQHIDAGDAAISGNDLAKAITEYKAAITIKPKSSIAHIKLAQTYAKQEEYELAQKEFREGLQLDPGNIPARNYLGYLHEILKQYQQAAEQFKTVLKYDPKNIYALNHLGLAYRQLKQPNEAETILRKVLEIDPECQEPESENVHNYLGMVYEDKGEINTAITEYRESIRLFPNDIWARKQLAILLENQGRYYEAQIEYLEILKIDQENLLARSRLNALEELMTGRAAVTHVEPVNIVEDDIEAVIARAPDASAYQDADALILLNKFSHEVLEDGRSRYTTHQIVKIFTERGIDSYGEVAIPFNTRTQNIEFNIARTILPDGVEITASDNAFHDVTPPGLLAYNLFSDVMWKIVALPALKENVIIEYQATVEDAKETVTGGKRWFWGGMAFQTTDPILISRYALRVTKDVTFKWKTYDCALQPLILHNNDATTTYLWSYGETPAIQLELGIVSISDIVPRLSYSSVESWDEVAQWYDELARERYDIDDAIESKVTELTADLTSKEEKIEAIYYFVASQIRYVGIEYGKGAYQPRSAQDVLKNRYGDCKDKVTLMIAMLRLVGVEAFPAMINPAPYSHVDVELPSPGQFNHVIAALPTENGERRTEDGERRMENGLPTSDLRLPTSDFRWLDPTSETCSHIDLPASDQGRKAFVITNDGGIFVDTPTAPPQANTLSLSSEITVNADGSIHGREQTRASGQHNLEQRLLYKSLKKSEIRTFFAAALNHQYPGVTIEDVRISNLNDLSMPVETTIEFSAPEYGMPLVDKLLLHIPSDNFATYATLVGPPERKYDLNLGYPMQIEKRVTISIPKEYTIPSLPPNIELIYDFGRFTRGYTFDGNMVKYDTTFTIQKPIVPSQQYHELKQFLETIAREDKAQIVLEKKMLVE